MASAMFPLIHEEEGSNEYSTEELQDNSSDSDTSEPQQDDASKSPRDDLNDSYVTSGMSEIHSNCASSTVGSEWSDVDELSYRSDANDLPLDHRERFELSYHSESKQESDDQGSGHPLKESTSCGVSYPPSSNRESEVCGVSYPPSSNRESEVDGVSYPPSSNRESEVRGVSYPPSSNRESEVCGVSYPPETKDSSINCTEDSRNLLEELNKLIDDHPNDRKPWRRPGDTYAAGALHSSFPVPLLDSTGLEKHDRVFNLNSSSRSGFYIDIFYRLRYWSQRSISNDPQSLLISWNEFVKLRPMELVDRLARARSKLIYGNIHLRAEHIHRLCRKEGIACAAPRHCQLCPENLTIATRFELPVLSPDTELYKAIDSFYKSVLKHDSNGGGVAKSIPVFPPVNFLSISTPIFPSSDAPPRDFPSYNQGGKEAISPETNLIIPRMRQPPAVKPRVVKPVARAAAATRSRIDTVPVTPYEAFMEERVAILEENLRQNEQRTQLISNVMINLLQHRARAAEEELVMIATASKALSGTKRRHPSNEDEKNNESCP